MNRMFVWEKVCTSDPSVLKKVKLGRTFTAIDAHSQVQEATKLFGPIGQNWGIKDEQYEIIDTGFGKLFLYSGVFWFNSDINNEQIKGQFPIGSSIDLTISRKDDRGNYVYKPDEDFYKKVRTDALTKGLSYLGFNADVFLGKFDANKYTNKQNNYQDKTQKKFDPKAKIGFGKHANETWESVQANWLGWASENLSNPLIKSFAQKALKLRQGNNSTKENKNTGDTSIQDNIASMIRDLANSGIEAYSDSNKLAVNMKSSIGKSNLYHCNDEILLKKYEKEVAKDHDAFC